MLLNDISRTIVSELIYKEVVASMHNHNTGAKSKYTETHLLINKHNSY